MPQPADHDLIAAFVRSKRDWSRHHAENATGILNRWHAWLTTIHPGLELVDVDGEHCDEFLRARAGGTTGLCSRGSGRPLGPVVGATLHKEYQALCWLYEWLVRRGHVGPTERRLRGGKVILTDPAPLGPMADVEAPRISEPDPRRIRHVTDGDYRRLRDSFDMRDVLDARNAAMCSLMYWSGVRRSEVVGAERANYDAERGVLMTLGKGDPPKWRRVVLLAETIELFDHYLYLRRDDPAAALFASSMGGAEADTTGRLKPDAVSAMLERRWARLGIRVSAHQFRRASVIGAKRRGVAESEIVRQHGWTPESAKKMIPRYTADQADELVEEAYRATDPTVRRGRRRLRAV